MRVTVTVRGLDRLAARLAALAPAVAGEGRGAVAEQGEATLAQVRERTPVKSGFTRDAARTVLEDDGLAAHTGWAAEDFTNAGRPFTPPYLEYGTRNTPATPMLGPAFQELRQTFPAAAAAAAARALRKETRGQ